MMVTNVKWISLTLTLISGVYIQGCASTAPKPEKQILDTANIGSVPSWVQDTKSSWIGENGSHKFKAFYSIKGDERINACYVLAKLNVREEITSEIWSDFKSAVSHSTQGISESMEDIFIQSRNNDTKGNVRGLRFTDTFHQRYLVNGVERIDCYVLSDISDADYRQMRAHLLSPVVQASPELRKAVEEQHMELFRPSKPENTPQPAVRNTAAVTAANVPVSGASQAPVSAMEPGIVPANVATELPKQTVTSVNAAPATH